MLKSIRLPRGEWFYDPENRLGNGNFATVFAGHSAEHGEIAVKQLRVGTADEVCSTRRELEIANQLVGKSFQHVVPIFDSGRDTQSDFNYVVMAKAERTLDEDLKRGVPFDQQKAVTILLDLAKGLEEVADIVHRDLKPKNILLHQDRWKIADFGIARFIEESTSDETLKDFKSKPYAAPEQFEGKRATAETDIYSLGCIGYALLTGKSPFDGPAEEYKDKHLNERPKPISHVSLELRTLLLRMLEKKQASRPSRESVKRQLENILVPPSRNEPVASLTVPGVASQPDLAEILARIHSQAEILEDSRAVQEQEKVEAEKVLQRLREPFNRIAEAFRETKLSEGLCQQIGSMSTLLFRASDAKNGLWSKGLSVSASSMGAKSASLRSGVIPREHGRIDLQCIVQVDLHSGSMVRLVTGFIIKMRGKLEPIGAWQEVALLGSASLDNSINNLVGHLTAQLPTALERFFQVLSSSK
ncbi:MAG: hypothetical protein C0467_16145 [Planctomycetaceae bacterium]|nr:hypothetical protein [Planctomycetaceae bacterium]